jgi:hypothetical protein
MRKWIALAIVITATVVPAAVLAQGRVGRVSGSGDAELNRQAFHFTTGDSQTSRTQYSNVQGLGREVCAGGNVVGTVTLNLGGGLTDIRIVDHGPGGLQILHPASVRANPTAGTTGFTFSFVEALGAAHLHTFNPQWKSVTGGPITLTGGALILQYKTEPQAC